MADTCGCPSYLKEMILKLIGWIIGIWPYLRNKMKKFIVILCYLGAVLPAFAQTKHTFALGDSAFLLDGKPFQIISGEIHYPRVPSETSRVGMKMAKASGLNNNSTFVF